MTSTGQVGRLLRDVATAVRVAGMTTGLWDANPVPRRWTHVTKVDPEERKRLPLLYPLYLSHTDAVSVGGSSGVTATNTEELFRLLDVPATPAFHEPSEARHVTTETRDRAAFVAIPEVLNGDTEALVGILGEGIAYLSDEMVPDLLAAKLPAVLCRHLGDALASLGTSWFLERAVFEAYLIQNPDSAAARRGGVTEDDLLSPSAARERAMVADRHLDSEVVYLEYSGTYGGDEAVDILGALDGQLERARVWYGGGIDDRAKATEVLEAGADTVVVGDIFHDVATEEARLCDRAAGALTDPTPAAVADWLADAVDVADTRAADYLRTVPSVAAPERTAETYLTLSVGLYATLAGRAADVPGRNPLGPRDLPQPWRRRLDASFDDAGVDLESYLHELAVPAVVGADTPEPVHHLSVAASNDAGDD